MRELIFEVTQEGDGGFIAECLTDSIVTEADTWDELCHNVKEVVRAFYFDQLDKLPTTIRLHLVKTRFLHTYETSAGPCWPCAGQVPLSRLRLSRCPPGR